MKMKAEHVGKIQNAIKALSPETVAAIKARAAADPRVKDLAKRIRWDLFNATGLLDWTCHELYAYLNDTHIDTALRAIVAYLEGAQHWEAHS